MRHPSRGHLDLLLDAVEATAPRDLLTTVARYHGLDAIEAFYGNHGMTAAVFCTEDEDVRAFLADAGRTAIDAGLAAEHARLAWRFALAAVRLDGPSAEHADARRQDGAHPSADR